MNPLFSVALFWAVLLFAMTLFGIACIKCGVYTSGSHTNQATLEL